MDKAPSPVPGLPAHSAAASLACQDLRILPSLPPHKGEEEEATSSLQGCRDPGLLESQPNPVLSSGSGIQTQDQRLPKRRPIQGKRYQCSGDGCRMAFRSMRELLDHLSVHYRPTQSLEGKTFCCSVLGCAETFPCMQDLVEHTKIHCKPNRYFKCENCLSRFQTHRSLFKHLHVCSDPRGPLSGPPEEKPALAATAGLEKEPPGKSLNRLPKFQSVIQHAKKEVVLPEGTEATSSALERDLLPAGLPSPLGPAPLPSPASHPFSLLEPPLFGPPSPARSSGPPHAPVPGPFLPYMHPPPFPLPQNRLRPYLPGQGLPVSNAVWKKSQGHSSNSRIVWEHTRGRYKCLQCSYSTASRKEMTQHLEDHRKNAPPPGRLEGEMDFGVSLPSFHSKMPPEMDASLYSSL
ncbi:zinc finger protein 414-like isoform X2 [Heteronotia binoei]|uniref:zinc finger protein 414-like isoform X2 n=1 Tax=Heteronotia binoei TaxID=13085 RepID=UPI00292D52A0|nr:zinc finger protein 414-like isoform X2 [Heteronotia binoei]